MLIWDGNLNEKNALAVIDLKENQKNLEMDIGFNIDSVFKKTNSDMIVSYLDSLNSSNNKSVEAPFARIFRK